MTLTERDRQAAREVAASMPPLTAEQIALLRRALAPEVRRQMQQEAA